MRPFLLVPAVCFVFGAGARADAPAGPTARVHVDPVRPQRETLFVFFRGTGSIGVGKESPRPRADTLRLVTPVNFTAELAAGDLHVVSANGHPLNLTATLTAAPALRLAAEGANVILDRGGSGIRTVP